MASFAVVTVHGPGWDRSRPIREQDGWPAHAAFMDGLVDDGLIVIGGPVGSGERTLHLFEATDMTVRPFTPAGRPRRSLSVTTQNLPGAPERRFCAHEDPSVAAHSALQITRFGAPWLERERPG
jgi:hypothetical protein